MKKPYTFTKTLFFVFSGNLRLIRRNYITFVKFNNFDMIFDFSLHSTLFSETNLLQNSHVKVLF